MGDVMTMDEFLALPPDMRYGVAVLVDNVDDAALQAEQDRATGAAFRRLVESGDSFEVLLNGDGDVGIRIPHVTVWADTLPEAVFKALGPEV